MSRLVLSVLIPWVIALAKGAEINILVSADKIKDDSTLSADSSWAAIDSSALDNATLLRSVDSFTVCMRLKFRMVPEGQVVFIGKDIDDWSGDWVFRPWLASGEEKTGPRKSGFFFRFSDRFWIFLKDLNKTEDKAYDLIVPNQWSHFCMGFSSETKLFRMVLVGIKL